MIVDKSNSIQIFNISNKKTFENDNGKQHKSKS